MNSKYFIGIAFLVIILAGFILVSKKILNNNILK